MTSPRKRNVWPFLAGGVLLLLVIVGITNSKTTPTTSASHAGGIPAPSDPPGLAVTRVVDGDTVDLNDGRRVRLLGIDAPELGECGFDQAGTFARSILLGQRVDVAPDPTQESVDRYGRSLVYITVGNQDYSTAAAAAGWATSYTFATPVRKAPAIAAAQAAAQHQRLGIWGTPGCATPASSATSPTPSSKPAPPTRASEGQAAPDPHPVPAPAPGPKPKPTPASGSGCHPSYQPCVPDGPDLDCPEIGYQVKVVGPDEYRLDGNNDGWGCERYA